MNAFRKIKDYNILEVSVALLLITLPLGHAVNSISIILFFLIALFFRIIKKDKIKFNKINSLLIGFYFLCLLSIFWTDNISNTREGITRFLSYLIIPLAFLLKKDLALKKENIFDLFSKSLVIYAAYCLGMGFIKAIISKDSIFLFYHELSGNLSGMNAIYLSVFLSFSIGYYLNKKSKSKLDLLSVIFLSFFLILLSSKIIIIFTMIFAIVLLSKNFKFKKVTKKRKIIIAAVFVLFFLASLNFIGRVKTEFHKTKITEVLNKKDFGHVYLWTGAGLRAFQIKAFLEISLTQKNFFLGSGLNNSQKNLNDKYKEYNFYPGFLNYNYHNQYIQVLAELGIIGMLLFVIIFFVMIKRAILYKDYFLLIFILLILVVSLTESFLWRQRGMVFFITILLLFNEKRKKIDFE